MDKIFIDFETYYDKQFSLSKMTTIEYVRDERFKVLGIAIQKNEEEPYYIEGDKLPNYDWSNSEVIAHNMLFDGMVLTQHYGIKAKRWTCTVALSRAMVPVKDHRLGRLATLLNLGKKGNALVQGATQSSAELAEYAINDVVIAKKLYDLLIGSIPEREREVIHITQRWGIEPLLQIDKHRMEACLIDAIDERQVLIEASGVEESVLVSNQKFERMLIDKGIEVPTKLNPDGSWIKTALSKGDPEFWASMAKQPQYYHIFAGRLAAKSNISITRPKKLLAVAKCSDDSRLPMPLKYYGAHTGRWSGTDGYNVQNLPRGSEIRKSIIAPKDHVIIAVDSAQIELRINAWWSDELEALELLKNGTDLYVATAATYFGKPPEDINADGRQLGKVMVLACGYGMGWKKFQGYIATGPLNMEPLLLSDQESQDVIKAYRTKFPYIASSWQRTNNHIRTMYAMIEGKCDSYKCIEFHKERLRLPNGMHIWYPCLDSSDEGGQWSFGYGKTKSHIYGARLQENIVQGLARVAISDQLLEIEKYGIKTVGSTHDEIIAVAHESEADAALDVMLGAMRASPDWAPDLPLDAKGDYDRCYSK